MSLGQLALGVASLIMGVHHINNGAKRLRNGKTRPRALNGLRGTQSPIYHQAAMDSGRHMVQLPNGTRVPMRMRSFHIRTLDDRIRYLNGLVNEGKRDPQVFAFARKAITKRCGNAWCIPEKDSLGEAKAVFRELRRTVPPRMSPQDLAAARKVFRHIRDNVRYTSDIAGVDTYQKPGHTLALKTADCLPEGTKLLKNDGTLVAIENVQIGDTIFDGSGWARVTNWWDKGIQDVRALDLNNGCTLRCTDGHKLFRIPRVKQSAGAASSAEEVQARDIKLGDELLQPREMSFLDTAEIDANAAFLIGAYLAEGSRKAYRVDGSLSRVSIAGVRDSKGIRERAIIAATALGLSVSEVDREIYLSNPGGNLIDNIFGYCGQNAPDKRLPHVCWSKTNAAQILEGLSADGGLSTSGLNFVFSTTSPVLAVQYRILQRILGRSCSIKRVVDHGGLGTHAIYRVTVRNDNTKRPWAKVRGISEAGETAVYDIETDSHRFYLPEQDIVVHNCDDFSSLTCSALGSIGIPCRFKVIRTKGANTWNHIYPQAGFPRANPKRWISMDSSVNMPFGWEAPPKMVAESRIFNVR